MCGIAGFLNKECSQNEASQIIEQMCFAIRHRGPDEQGNWISDGIALGMRRLAIIDVKGGQQPIFNEDRSVVVIFNGEIYNYRELYLELQMLGHQFATRTDTEVIAHAYEQYGIGCLERLRGMFALALWDQKQQRLLLARDRFGKKPLHYYWNGRKLIFASEIKSLLAAGVPREINHRALDDYLTYRYIPTPQTLFHGVTKLPAAHFLLYEHGQLSIEPYWHLSFLPQCYDDEQIAVARTRALLTEAVRIRLMSEVPLGAFLSGGLDSSLIVAIMSQLQARPVKTFSIGFEDEDVSELTYARIVARHFGTEHHEFMVKPDLVSILPQLAWAFDEPFADPSMLPTYYVSKLAREHVTVVLTGDGGDEIFAGYQRYQRHMALQRIPGLLRFLVGYGSLLLPEKTRGKQLLSSLRYSLAERYIRSFTLLPASLRKKLYSEDFFDQIKHHIPQDHLLHAFGTFSHLRDSVTQLQAVDIATYLMDDILTKVDKSSMFNSLETRAPLLDHHLAGYVASLRPHIRLQHGEPKFLLKQIAASMLPYEIINRPKQGFNPPIHRWLRGQLADYASDLLCGSRAQLRNIFNPEAVQHLLWNRQTHPQFDVSGLIWALICLEHWFQVYMDAPPKINCTGHLPSLSLQD